MSDDAEYVVGYRKPPLHARFKKGQSGNPGGRPGPAKRARKRLEEQLNRALDNQALHLAFAQPDTALEQMANRLVADSVLGRVTSMRLLLALLAEAEEGEKRAAAKKSRKRAPTETRPETNAPRRNETAPASLFEGESQGDFSKHTNITNETESPSGPVSDAGATRPPLPAADVVTDAPTIRIGTPAFRAGG